MVETLQTGKPIDFSIMPSFKCNLRCWFCMYDCSPENHMELNYEKTRNFLKQFDWGMVNAFGFYGGEPSIAMPLYDKFIALVPESTNKFVISNGSWSTDYAKTDEFLQWCSRHRLYIIVSSTPEHIKHQHRLYLENLSANLKGLLELKKPDEIHAQGRAKGSPLAITDCKLTCQRTDRNIRLGLKPDGNIVFQNCHGEYHIVQTYNEPFEGILERSQTIVRDCMSDKSQSSRCTQ